MYNENRMDVYSSISYQISRASNWIVTSSANKVWSPVLDRSPIERLLKTIWKLLEILNIILLFNKYKAYSRFDNLFLS